jgi:hypothetical protein
MLVAKQNLRWMPLCGGKPSARHKKGSQNNLAGGRRRQSKGCFFPLFNQVKLLPFSSSGKLLFGALSMAECCWAKPETIIPVGKMRLPVCLHGFRFLPFGKACQFNRQVLNCCKLSRLLLNLNKPKI